MGSSQQAIKVAIIDNRAQPQDFTAITENKMFACNYYTQYDNFLENQSLKELSYIIIRQKKEENKQQLQKIKESSVVAKTYRNMEQLENQLLSGNKTKREQLLRERLIAYIRKYSLQRLVIYVFVDNVLDFKIPEYQQPYINLVADKIQVIKNHLQQRPKGAEPLNFKFRRMMKDLYRRTVVKILTTETDKNQAKLQKEKWINCLGSKISSSISNFNEEQFQESLMSNYYEYIVVSNSASLSFIQDMKRKHKFQSLLIYFGNIQAYGLEQYKDQTQQKLNEIKKSLWMHSPKIEEICQAIQNCTDIIAQESNVPAKNVVVFTHLDYGAENQLFFVNKLTELLNDPAENRNSKGGDLHEKQWMKKMSFKVCSTRDKLKAELKKATFSYLVTFDCVLNEIQVLKAFLREQKLHKRAYMYNAEEKEPNLKKAKQNLNNNAKTREYLIQRAKQILAKAGFVIKFQIGPIDEISTYKATQKELMFLKYELGLQTENIKGIKEFQESYMSVHRQKIILGNTLLIKVKDYFDQFTKLVKKDKQSDPQSYLQKIKVVILDDARTIKDNLPSLCNQIKEQRIVFVHYNLCKINQFLDILYVPSINLSIFVKKALPNFYKGYQKLEENKFKRIEMTGSIVSKNQLLKQVFGDQNFKLSTQYELSFLKLANSNKNLQEALFVMHQQFLLRYGYMWRPGYQIVSLNNKERCIKTLKDDIKSCLFKCKAYQLLEVSQQQFQYFYLKRLQQCKTYLDLQILIVYMFSLPHGLANVIQLIFSKCLSTCLSPKVFSGLIVLLLSAFCSFQDQVMNKKRFVVYLDDSNNDHFKSIISALKIGDILFNSCFIMSGKDEDNNQNAKNNCIFLQFQDIPMLSQTYIKNYLYIQRFSFYKESTEYLIAPYTQFTVKNIDVSSLGKTHITLVATTDSKKGFVSKVFEANNIRQKQLFSCIISQISQANNFSEQQTRRIKETGSLYKKAELIGLYEQKLELIKSIREGLEYNNFLISARAKKYMTALSQIRRKQSQQKSTTEIQAAYFKKMLGVQKSMLYYNLCEYDMSIKELDKVIEYLQEQNVEEGQNWVIKKVKAYKQTVNQLNTKRHKYLNRAQKTKHWKIEPEIIKYNQPNKQTQSLKLGVKMITKKMQWTVGYDVQLEQFYIQNQKDEQLVHYNTKPAFGQLATAFPPNSSYQSINQRKLDQKQQVINQFLQMQLTWQIGKKQKNKKQRKDSGKQQQLLNKNKKQNSRTQLAKLDLVVQKQEETIIKKSNFSHQKLKENKVTISAPVKSQKEKVAFVQSPSKLQQTSKFSILRQKQSEIFLNESEIKMGIKEQVQWQAFYFNDKYLLTRKGKHYKTKIPNRHNL